VVNSLTTCLVAAVPRLAMTSELLTSRLFDRALNLSCQMETFQQVSVDEVISAIRRLPDKHCAIDPVPTHILKSVASDIAPYLCELFNRSLQSGCVPQPFKEAFITPLLKKPDLDAADVKSYRPISNLSVVSEASRTASS
jgi:hypothetical protein